MVLCGQPVKYAAILCDDLSTDVEDPRTDFYRRQNDDSIPDGRSDKVAFVEVSCAQCLLIEGHRQAVALPANLHGVHEHLPVDEIP